MKLKVEFVCSPCEGGPCPTIFTTERGTLLVQGYVPADGRPGKVIIPANMVDAVNSPAVGRVSSDALAVRGTSVDPADVEGLRAIEANEGLVEIPAGTFGELRRDQFVAPEVLQSWVSRNSGLLSSVGFDGHGL